MSKDGQPSKREILRQFGVLHAAAETVCDELFLANEFFDPQDLVQVKYEMLRRVRVDGRSVVQAACDYGFSRTAYYQALSSFEQQGLPGLIPKRPGPRHAHKLSDAVLEFVEEQLSSDELMRSVALAEMVRQKFGFTVHRRSIERALARHRKKGL